MNTTTPIFGIAYMQQFEYKFLEQFNTTMGKPRTPKAGAKKRG
jgi:hypothetical protein